MLNLKQNLNLAPSPVLGPLPGNNDYLETDDGEPLLTDDGKEILL